MMSPETPQQTEARLQRYAKERRAQGGDFALHPATRRLLQDEVRRQHGPAGKTRRGGAGWLGLWQGWLAIGGGVAAVILLATWMFQDAHQGKQSMQLAKNDPAMDVPRSLSRERKLEEVRDEAAKAVKELSLSKAKQDVSEPLARQPAAPAGAVVTSSLTPAPNASSGPVEANSSLNRSPAPAQTLYVNGTAPISQQNQASPPPPTRSAAQLSFQNAGGPAEQQRPVPQSGLENRSQTTPPADALRFGGAEKPISQLSAANGRSDGSTSQAKAGLALADNGLAGLAQEDKKQNASQAVKLMDSADPGQAGQDRRLNSGGTLLAGAASKDGVAVVPPAPAAQPLPVLAESGEKVAAVAAVSAPSAQAKANTPDYYRRVEVESLTLSGADPLKALGKKPAGPAPGADVLNDFTVEQRGGTLRLIDGDGSVYDGIIATTNLVADLDAETDRSDFKKELVREQPAKAEVGRQYFFRAKGSNVTLRQQVLVNGQVRATDEWLPARGLGLATNPATTARFMVSGGTLASTNRMSTMEGTVQIGTTNAQKFRAVRAARP